MNPELGHFAAIAATSVVGAAGMAAIYGVQTGKTVWVGVSRNLVLGHLVALTISFIGLTQAFLADDFSVRYVAENSNTLLPWYYKMSAVWGAHEGSFLLWCLIMAIWMAAVAVLSRSLPDAILGRVLFVMALLQVGFLLFLLVASNPFERLVPTVPAQGSDLNPLLQDVGLIIHPPLLYAGYVGFSVAFAFAVAALMNGRLDSAWARWSRPWTNLAWGFQTVGITLGSWWAYYELGWGGWWFWDPVENASFMPWLVGTALVHSLAVTEKRGAFKSWTVLLAIATFALCLVGTFIVRSGVLTSVHAFAVDPERGMYILAFLVIVVGGSLALYVVRAPDVRSRIRYGGVSRELLLLVNNLLLVIATAMVLVGTLYPLAFEALTGGEKVSVGPPYFNAQFVPLMLVLAAFLAFAPISRWKSTPLRLFKNMGFFLLGAAALGVVIPLVALGELKWGSVLAFTLGIWILTTHLYDAQVKRIRAAGYIGMLVAHIGFGISMIGIAVTSEFSIEKDVRLKIGESTTVGSVDYTLTDVSTVRGPNYSAQRGTFVTSTGVVLEPEQRRYLSRGDIMTEAGIDAGFFRDLFVALGDPIGTDSWGVRIQYKPLIRWIWLGAFLMFIGGVVATLDVRYRRLRARDAATSGLVHT